MCLVLCGAVERLEFSVERLAFSIERSGESIVESCAVESLMLLVNVNRGYPFAQPGGVGVLTCVSRKALLTIRCFPPFLRGRGSVGE